MASTGSKQQRPRNVLGPVRMQRLTETIVEQLEEAILGGEIAEGEKLPSEQQLAVQAGVGRRAIREALKALELKGLISIRKGSGAFVIRNDFDNYIETLTRNMQAYLMVDRAKLAHVLQFREILGGSVAGMLATNPVSEAIVQAEAAVERQRRACEKKSASLYTKAHIDFHLAIIDGAQNPVITMVYGQVIRVLEPYMKVSGSDPGIMRQSIREHQEIIDAIKAGDPGRAHACFHAHLAASLAHLKGLVDRGAV